MNIKLKALTGYDASLAVSQSDLLTLRWIVACAYLRAVKDAGIENYGNHAYVFRKMARCLLPPEVESLKKLPFMDTLRREFGRFSFPNVVLDNRWTGLKDEVYWRIVRPMQAADVGPAHSDIDFYVKDGTDHLQSVKCWMPLWCEPGCGLTVGTHHCDRPGSILLFGDRTLHGGAINGGKTARVSIEFRMVLEAEEVAA